MIAHTQGSVLPMTQTVATATLGKPGDWLSPEGLAEVLNVPLTTVYRWRHFNTGPVGVRLGRHVRYRRADVEAWLATRAQAEARPR